MLEKNIIPEQNSPDKKLYLNAFRGILFEYLKGVKTSAECRTAVETIIGETLSADKITAILGILAFIDTGVDAGDKSLKLAEVFTICELAEHGVWYGDQASLRARLQQIIPTWPNPV